MLKKSDFFADCPDDLISQLDKEYAYKKYYDIPKDEISKYLKENNATDIFLLDLEYVGSNAFYYFLPYILDYIKSQSRFWYDANTFDDYGNIEIDDSALSAFEILPSLIKSRLSLCSKNTENHNCEILREFTHWILHNIEKFDEEIFADKAETKNEYSELEKMLAKTALFVAQNS